MTRIETRLDAHKAAHESRFGKRGLGIPLRFGKRFDDGNEIAEMAQAWRHFKQADGADTASGENRKMENGVKSDAKSVGKAGVVDDVQNAAGDDVDGDSLTDDVEMASRTVDKRAPRRPMRFGKRSKTLRYSFMASFLQVFKA